MKSTAANEAAYKRGHSCLTLVADAEHHAYRPVPDRQQARLRFGQPACRTIHSTFYRPLCFLVFVIVLCYTWPEVKLRGFNMPGRYGLQLVVFSLLLDIARVLNIGGIRQADAIWWQINTILLCLGLASISVGFMKRLWLVLREEG
jgi:hypothetical protein